MKKFLTTLGMGALTFAPMVTAIACGNNGGGGDAPQTDKELLGDNEEKGKLVFFKSNDASAYDEMLYQKARKYAGELGYVVEMNSSAGLDTTEKTNVTTALSSGKYKGAIFQPVNTAGSIESLKELLKDNMKTVLVDRIFPDADIQGLDDTYEKNIVAQITSDNKAIAGQAAEKLLEYLKANNSTITNDEDINGKKIVLMKGESGADSSRERKEGFKQFFTDNNLTPEYVELEGNWNSAIASTQFTTKATSAAEVGIGAFAFNDQMADGIIKSDGNKNVLASIDYPIVTVDATSDYKDQIAEKATDPEKRVIANYAQRADSTMKFAVQALIYSFDKDAVKETTLKGVLDETITWTIPVEKASYDGSTQTLKLSGVAITRKADGTLENEESLI